MIELATVSGHKSLRLFQRHHHPKAEDLAKKLGRLKCEELGSTQLLVFFDQNFVEKAIKFKSIGLRLMHSECPFMRLVKLTSPSLSKPLTKTISGGTSAGYSIQGYSQVKWFMAGTVEIEDLHALSALMKQMETEPQASLIRGALHPDADTSKLLRRRKHLPEEPANEAPFVDQAIHWMMIDIDKLRLPQGLELLDAPEEAIKFAISQLPQEFHDSSVHWQLSSSSGIKSQGTVSAHLHFWLSDAKTSYELKQWAKALNANLESRLIDDSLFTPVQLHYTAAPVFATDAHDPLSGRRSGFLQGKSKTVTLSNISTAQKALTAKNTSAALNTTHGYEQIMAGLGDDKEGFYEPLLRATASFVSKHGSEEAEAQKEAIKADIRYRIAKADSSGHDQAGLERYASDAYLDGLIDSAIAKYGDKHNLPPYFDIQELTLAEAEAKLQVAIKTFGERVKAYWSETSEWFEDAPAIAIRATAGLGKTSRVINDLIKYNAIELGDIHYYAPTHNLIKQLEHDLNEALTIETPNVSIIRTNVISGREQSDEAGVPLCIKKALAKKVAEAGLNVSTTLCKSGTRKCEHYDTCGYQRQFISSETVEEAKKVHNNLVMATGGLSYETLFSVTQCLPHAHLFLNTKGRLPKPKLVIVDEAFWRGAVEEICISTNDLLMCETPLAKLIHETLVQPEPPPLLKTLRVQGISPDALRNEAERIEQQEDGTSSLRPDTPEPQVERILKERTAVLQTPRVLRQLAEELELVDRDASHSLRYEPRDVNTSDAKKDKLVLTRLKRFCVGDDVPILFIDANANEEILKLFRADVEIIDIPVQRQATIHQFTDLTFSKTSLMKDELRGQVQDFIERISNNGRTLVVSTKAIRDLLEQEVTNTPQGLLSPPPVSFAHFGNLRGLNAYAEFDNVIVVGREQAPANAIEDQARALWWDASFPIKALPTQSGNRPMPNEHRGYRTSGNSKSVQVAVHPDSRVQTLLEQGREAESEQAFDRLRLLREPKGRPRNVYLLSNLPLNATVDHLYGWDEIQKLLSLWNESEGVLPLNAAQLQLRCPKHATSESTAKRLISDWKRVNSLIVGLISNVTLLSASYRMAGSKAKMSIAIVDAALSEIAIRAALSDAAGAEIELIA